MSDFTKDPEDVLDYTFDFTAWLAKVSDSISSYTITEEAGITLDSHSNDANTVTVWLSGGTAGESYEVECKIVTVGGRTAERTMMIPVEEL